MSRRTSNRRGFKKRGILPSFGDIVLPVVSIAAVGLLILAGRQFFITGIKTSPGITSTRAYADSPAIIAEKEKAQENLTSAKAKEDVKPKTADTKANHNLVTAVSENEFAPPVAEVKPVVPQPDKKMTPAKKPVPPKKPEPVKKTEPPKKAEPPKKTPAAPAKSSLPLSKQWRVQTGAYTSKASAQEAAKKINRAGYKATVYQNPESKHIKVWVAGGESKYQAGLVVAAMKKLGYKSSFAFPPAK